MKRLLFVADPARAGSYVIRARTIAERLASRGYPVEVFFFEGRRSLPALWWKLRAADVVFCVKHFPAAAAAAFALSGRKAIYDCIDNFHFGTAYAYHGGRRHISAYITNNESHRRYVEANIAQPGQRTCVIEHHHSNLSRQRKPFAGVRTIGYVGNPKDFAIGEPFRRWAAEQGFELKVDHDPHMSNEQAVAANLELDLFLMLLPQATEQGPEAERLARVVNFKPAQKILLPFSLGIPAICAPYQAYLDAITAAGLSPKDFLFATTEAQLRELVLKVADPAQRTWVQGLIERQATVAECYHLDRIVEKYEALIRDSA